MSVSIRPLADRVLVEAAPAEERTATETPEAGEGAAEVDATITTKYAKLSGPKKTGLVIDLDSFNKKEKSVEDARKKKRKRISKDPAPAPKKPGTAQITKSKGFRISCSSFLLVTSKISGISLSHFFIAFSKASSLKSVIVTKCFFAKSIAIVEPTIPAPNTIILLIFFEIKV